MRWSQYYLFTSREVPADAEVVSHRLMARTGMLRELTRLVEEVDATRQRAAVVQDELANQLAEQANQRIYLLTVITAMFLPLTLVSGLFGMNVGGIPLADNPFGFIITNGILLVVAIGSLLLARRQGWI